MPFSMMRKAFQNISGWFFPAADHSCPLFSIVIPVFQAAEKLEHSIRSVLRQPRGLWELLVIDGNSTDETMDVVRAHENHIEYSTSEQDSGVYDAMNKGLARARGRYLYFLGAGDRLRDGVLERVSEHLPERRIGFVYGNVWMHDRKVIWDGPWTARKFRKRTPCQQAIFYDRRIFARHGGFELRYPALADYAMNIRCFGDRWIEKVYLDEIIADYEGGGLSASHGDECFHRERPALLRRHLGIKD